MSMAVDPFPASAVQLSFHTNDAQLTNGMATISASFPDMAAALVDLTDDPELPPYGGFRDTEMLYPGSVLKICAMYAAHELRSRVRASVADAIAGGLSTSARGWEQTVIADIEAQWRPILASVFPSLPPAAFPQIASILTFSPDGSVDFTQSSPRMTDRAIDAVREGTPQGRYRDWMRSMLRWSNDEAASRCILALGYPYINGVLVGAEFIDQALSSGLWMSADYAGHDWIPNPASDPQANKAGRPLSPFWASKQGRNLSNLAGTAAQVATFMTLLAKDLLVNAEASQQMRLMMSGAAGIGSYVSEAFDFAVPRRPYDSIVSKIGLGDDNLSHDSAIVERTVDGKSIRYVVVGFGSDLPLRADFQDLILRMDDMIVARNA
jgi:hypothetical protein